MKKITYKWSAFLIGILLVFASCQTELEKYYQTPDWLKGNSWEVLEKKGNFKLFLEAVERTSFKDLVQGKGVITVMAPTDSAFQVYLDKHNYSSVAAVPDSVLTKLVGYHLVFYSFTKEAFENYKPNGVESENVLKGMYYKYRTKSRDAISVVPDPAYNDFPRRVIHKDRFLPVFSYNLFESFMIDAKSNYEFFYPGSKWTGSAGFNVSNASVKEYAIVTDNGYVYVLDQVLEPLETIYKTLENAQGFDQFKNAYNRFVTFEYDATSTAEYGNGDSLYIMNHGDQLPPIASEWPVSDYTQLAILSYGAYSLFAPDNTAMQAFFNKYWSPYYSSIDSVHFEPLLALLQNHFYAGTILFPEQIEAGELKTSYGSLIQFDRTSAKMKSICTNGSLYGLDHVLIPPMFEKVTSPMYCNPNYNIILDMMKNAQLVQTLISDAIKFNVFYPTDHMITMYTNLEGRAIQYQNLNSKKYGAQEVQIDGDLGFTAMSRSQKKTFASGHVGTELLTTKGDEAIYRTLNSYNYIYTKGNKVYSSALFNLGDDAKVPTFTKINGDWTNGNAYALQGETASALVPESNQFKAMITSIASPVVFTNFKLAIQSAALDKTSPPFDFLQGERFIAFIPKDDAILAGWTSGKIPFSPASTVTSYLKRYFVNVGASNLLDYPFSGAGIQGEIKTFATNASGVAVKFTLVDTDGQLYVKDGKGNMVKVISYFPYIYADGAAYLIDGLLETE
ncbi:MAG: fasciclin domain-containing protein [Paludibacter sp.]|nr:fasciclin domain-containing protein [Paludibacter sp.]